MFKTIFNIVLLGIPYVWKFVKNKWGAKIDDKVEHVIDDVVDAIDDEDETESIVKPSGE